VLNQNNLCILVDLSKIPGVFLNDAGVYFARIVRLLSGDQ